MSASTQYSVVELRTLDPDVDAMMATPPPPPVKTPKGAISKWLPLALQWSRAGHGMADVYRHIRREEQKSAKILLPATVTEAQFVRAISGAAATRGLGFRKKGGQGT